MYCSSCGNTVPEHLNYCSTCGARIERDQKSSEGHPASYIATAAAVVGGVGIFASIAILKILLESRLNETAIVIILISYFVMVFLIFGVLAGHLWKHVPEKETKHRELPDVYTSPRSFRPVNTSQLEAGREPAVSITEHTTRTLEADPIERR